MTDNKHIVAITVLFIDPCRNEGTESLSLMEIDKGDVLAKDNIIGSPSVIEKRMNSVDNESDSPHATTDDLSDGVTLAAADSTTPEVDTYFEKVAR